ncbi:Hemolysin XhlA, partial [Dysosmobacter welbionis]
DIQVIPRRPQFIARHLFRREWRIIDQFAPCQGGAVFHRLPLVVKDQLHLRGLWRLWIGPNINGALCGIIFVFHGHHLNVLGFFVVWTVGIYALRQNAFSPPAPL